MEVVFRRQEPVFEPNNELFLTRVSPFFSIAAKPEQLPIIIEAPSVQIEPIIFELKLCLLKNPLTSLNTNFAVVVLGNGNKTKTLPQLSFP